MKYVISRKLIGIGLAIVASVDGNLNQTTNNKQQNMKNKLITIAGAAILTLALAQTVQAIPVTGGIGFTGRATFDTSSAGTATEVTSWINPKVNGTSGSFTSVADGTSVGFNPTWFFNSASISPFWIVGGFTYNLTASSITIQSSGAVLVNGIGTVNGNSYDSTPMSWSFTSQDPAVGSNPDSWTFSASTSALVPDGGTTLTLLGIALSGVALLRKKLTA